MQKVTSDHSAHTEKNFDVLGDVLETLRFRGSIFFRSQLAAPWGMKLESAMAPRFHIAMDGNCVLGAGEDSTLVKLKHMDIVLLPHGDMHWSRRWRRVSTSRWMATACWAQARTAPW